MRHLVTAILVLGAAFAPAFAVAADPSAEQLAALAGGTALSGPARELVVPPVGKQSISFTSEADEVIVGTVAFAGDAPLGTLSLDPATGAGKGSITIPVASLKTGNAKRDEHLVSPNWMDAAAHPAITFTDVVFTRVKDTVWKLSGTWTMHGVAKPLTIFANIRQVAKMPGLGENLVRIKSSFELELAEFGLTNPGIGSPAVAKAWRVDVTLLALDKK